MFSFLQKALKYTKVLSFQSNEHIRKKVDGPYFEVSAIKSLISDPVLAMINLSIMTLSTSYLRKDSITLKQGKVYTKS